MSKLILLLLLAAVLYLLLRAPTRRPMQRSGDPHGPGKRHQPATESFAESFVICAHCGLNVPRSEALQAHGRHYCCEEHRRLG